jgi:hypothetical protein
VGSTNRSRSQVEYDSTNRFSQEGISAVMDLFSRLQPGRPGPGRRRSSWRQNILFLRGLTGAITIAAPPAAGRLRHARQSPSCFALARLPSSAPAQRGGRAGGGSSASGPGGCGQSLADSSALPRSHASATAALLRPARRNPLAIRRACLAFSRWRHTFWGLVPGRPSGLDARSFTWQNSTYVGCDAPSEGAAA